MFRGILDNVLSGMKAGFKAILNLEHPIERKKMDTQKGIVPLLSVGACPQQDSPSKVFGFRE